MKTALIFFLILIFSISCGKLNIFKKSSQTNDTPLTVAGTLKVNVFYEPGAEPYTELNGSLLNLPVPSIQVWNVLQENLKALYPGKTIVVPKILSQMSKLKAKNRTQWSYSQLKELGDDLGTASTGNTTHLNLFFLNGRSSENANAIGVHLSGTSTMGIFKDVIRASDPTLFVQYYVEQATLVHEIGHAIGLVNNGIRMVKDHEDSTHHHHCNNPKCVMYWLNEGAQDLKDFITSRKDNPDLVMFDQACLRDVTSQK